MFVEDDIATKVKAGKVRWSQHAIMRMQKRGISPADVLAYLSNGEIIETYPDYWAGPATLVLGESAAQDKLHVVVGLDDYAHVITAYFPSEDKFEPDMKTRKGA